MKPKLPAIVKVSDYHKFDSISDAFKQIGLKLKVKEIAFIEGEYIGIVYAGKLTDIKNKQLVTYWKHREAEDALYSDEVTGW